MTEHYKYDSIKKLVDTNGNKQAAALKLGCTIRSINRYISGYKSKGKSFFVHGNRGKKPAHTIPNEVVNTIVDLYRNKYCDANFTHFSELLSSHENISISTGSVRTILMNEGILSPKANRSTIKKVRKALETRKKEATTKKERDQIQKDLFLLEEDAHPRRPRCAYVGEMIQMDASLHHWFGDKKTQLHIAVDDCTGSIVGAFFDHQETLNGYYNVFYQILNNYGIPYMFYTDRRTVFEYKQKKSTSIEADTFTQFGYACKQFGVEIKTTSVPQAKGRVERIFQTLQSRLPVELRLAGASSLAKANIFLNSYIKEYNAKFALPINNSKSVFEKQPDEQKINLTLAVLANRKIDNGHCIRIDNKFYKPTNAKGYPVYYHKGTKALVIKAFDGNIYASINDTVYSLEEVPTHEHTSRNFEFTEIVVLPRKRYIPPLSHPWRQSSFSKFVSKQKHRYEQDFLTAANSQAMRF